MKDKEIYGLLKIPDSVIIKELRIEIGKLESYILELENSNKKKNGVINKLTSENNDLRKANNYLKLKQLENGNK